MQSRITYPATVYCCSSDRHLKQQVRAAVETMGCCFESITSPNEIGGTAANSIHCVVAKIEKDCAAFLLTPDSEQKIMPNGPLAPFSTLLGVVDHGDVANALIAIRLGACAVLEKPIKRANLILHLQAAIDMERLYLKQRQTSRQRNSSFAALDDRQQQVLQLLMDGRTNREVARNLEISLRTVELERAQIMQKVGANSFSDLVKLTMIENSRNTTEPPQLFYEYLKKRTSSSS